MMFEVGKSYESNDPGLSIITVLKRTGKMIKVRNDRGYEWRMKIRVDDDGNEFAYESALGKKWIDAFTYKACWEV